MLILSSCEDNFDFTKEEITTSEPTQVGVVLLQGQILDINNVAIPEAEVNISHDGKIISTTGDENGYYSIELPQDSSRILLQAHADNYLTSGIDALVLDSSDKLNNLKLLKSSDLDYSGEVTSLSASTEGVLSGQILFEDNSPGTDITILLLDIATFTLNSYDVTDIDGNYQFAVDPFVNGVLLVVSDCNGTETIAEIAEHGSEDQNFGITQTQFEEIDQFTVSGNVINCNTNEGLISGQVGISFDGNSKYYSSNIVDGRYEIIVDNCLESSCYNVSISAPQEIEGNLEINCVEITSSQMEADYTLCGEDVSTIGEFRLLVGTDSLIYSRAEASVDASTGFWSGFGQNINPDVSDFILIESEADGVGTFGVMNLGLSAESINTSGFIQQSGSPFKFEIIEINEYLRGRISGDIQGPDGSQIPLFGTFNIKL